MRLWRNLGASPFGICGKGKLGNHQYTAARLLHVEIHLAFGIAKDAVAEYTLAQTVCFLFVVILSTPNNTKSPAPISPVTSPSTVTLARVTR